VTPNGAMVGTVTVTCAPGSSPPGVTCDPLSIAVNGSGPFSGQLTVHVAAPSTPGATAEIQAATRIEYAGLQTQPVGRSRWWKLSAGTGLAAIFLFIVPGRRRYRITLGLWLICVLSLPIGCGGGGGGGVVGPIATATKITAPTTKAAQGAALTFNVAVTAAGAPSGNGTVQLLDGGNVVATASAVNGVATFTNITSLGPGTHTISAHYSGDTSTQASQSGGVNVTVTGNTTVGIATNPASSNSNATISLTIN